MTTIYFVNDRMTPTPYRKAVVNEDHVDWFLKMGAVRTQDEARKLTEAAIKGEDSVEASILPGHTTQNTPSVFTKPVDPVEAEKDADADPEFIQKEGQPTFGTVTIEHSPEDVISAYFETVDEQTTSKDVGNIVESLTKKPFKTGGRLNAVKGRAKAAIRKHLEKQE